MPEIIPVLPQGTMMIQQNTQTPSAKLASQQPQTLPPPTTEAPTEAKEDKVEEADSSQKKLRALLYRERQLFNQRKKLEGEMKAFEEMRSKYKNWIEAGEMSSQNKLEALAKTGITYDELTQQIINNGQVPPAQIAELKAQETVRREIEAFKREQAALSAQQQKAQYDQGIKQLESEVRFLVDKEDKYPLVKEAEAYQDIVKWIESEFHRTGRLIPVEDAIARWESEALEGLQELAKLEKIRDKFTPQETPKPITPPQLNTLSQRATAPIPSPRPMTEAERRQKAIDAFYGRQT